MSKLLNAGFVRMFKSKAFWIFPAIMSLFFILSANNSSHSIGEFLSKHSIFSVLFAAGFCSMFFGTDYNDGTIRNKLIIGHSRLSVYLSNLIIALSAQIIFFAVYSVFCVIMVWIRGDLFQSEITSIIIYTLIINIAFTAIFVLIAMLTKSKAISAIVSVIVALVLISAGFYINSRLSEPEFNDYFKLTENGIEIEENAEKNPLYLEGTAREVFEFFREFLPTSQSLDLAENNDLKPTMIPYNLLIAAAATTAGLLVFRKKDIN